MDFQWNETAKWILDGKKVGYKNIWFILLFYGVGLVFGGNHTWRYSKWLCSVYHTLTHTSSFPYHPIFKIHSTLNNSHCILTKCYSVCCLLKYMSSWAIKILWVHWFFLLMFNNSGNLHIYVYVCIIHEFFRTKFSTVQISVSIWGKETVFLYERMIQWSFLEENGYEHVQWLIFNDGVIRQ